jgi:hypothetical protein
MCRYNPLADELLQLLTADSGEGSSSAARRRIDTLLNELQEVEGLQFVEQLLQGGPWRVSETQTRPHSGWHVAGTWLRPSCVSGLCVLPPPATNQGSSLQVGWCLHPTALVSPPSCRCCTLVAHLSSGKPLTQQASWYAHPTQPHRTWTLQGGQLSTGQSIWETSYG